MVVETELSLQRQRLFYPEHWSNDDYNSYVAAGGTAKGVMLYRSVGGLAAWRRCSESECAQKDWVEGSRVEEPHFNEGITGRGLYAVSFENHAYTTYSQGGKLALVHMKIEDYIAGKNTIFKAQAFSVCHVIDSADRRRTEYFRLYQELLSLSPQLLYRSLQKIGREASSWDDVIHILSRGRP